MTLQQRKRAKLAAAGVVVAAGVVAATLTQSGPVTVHPGEDVAKVVRSLKPGGVVTFQPGTYRGQLTLDGLRNVTLNCAGATFSGGVCALKLTGFSNVTVNGGEFDRASYGLMLQDGDGATVTASKALENATTGFLVANSRNVEFRGCEGSRSRTQWGFYASQSSDHIRIINCTANGNARGAVQVNANDPHRSGDPLHDAISEDLTISGGQFDGNQSLGGAVINLASVRGARITDCAITNAKGRSLLALWDDGMGAGYACRDVQIDRITGSFAGGKGKALVSVKYAPDQVKVGAITVPGWKGTVIEKQ